MQKRKSLENRAFRAFSWSVSDQSVSANYADVSGWSDILYFETTGENVIGIKADGTVVAAKILARSRDINVSQLSNIIAVRCEEKSIEAMSATGVLYALNQGPTAKVRDCGKIDWLKPFLLDLKAGR